jgi:thioredoxin-dependent peroxiredoxin
MLVYPMSTGRNFAEVLRALDSIQLTAAHGVSTPVNWKNGDDVVVPAAMPDEDVKKKFPKGLRVLRPYLRFGAQPK